MKSSVGLPMTKAMNEDVILNPTVQSRRICEKPQSEEPQERGPGTLIADRYRLVEVLGCGGMGEVWRAVQIDLDQEVALKLLRDCPQTNVAHEELRGRFRHEARLLASLNDERIVQYLDHGETADGTLFIAMEMLNGQTLESYLKTSDRLTWREVLDLIDEISLGLQSAHEQGLIHRDLKPGNIFLTQTESGPFIRILDFGIAKTLDAGEPEGAPRTRTGMFIGSPHYMAPEQFEGRPQTTTDLYALGIIAWECLVGRRPFEGTTASVAGKHLMQQAPELPLELAIPEEFAMLVMSLLEKDPTHRPQSVRKLRIRINHLRDDLRLPPPTTVNQRRNILLAAFFSTIVGGLAGWPSTIDHLQWLSQQAFSFVVPPTPAVPTGMVEVPAGAFFKGCSPASDPSCKDKSPVGHSIKVAAFAIDSLEVTVERYTQCVEEGACSPEGLQTPAIDGQPNQAYAEHCNWGKPGRTNHPINCITWYQAAQYCEAMGARLPTEVEWEKAARGVDARRFPWGNQIFQHREANIADRTARKKFRWNFAARNYTDLRPSTGPAGEIPGGASPYGALDMVGNVWEWTSTQPQKSYRVFRGASFMEGPESARVTSRAIGHVTTRSVNIGFRCAAPL